MTFLSVHQNNPPNISDDEYFIPPLDGISLNNKNTPILNDKITHLDQNYVTMKDLLDYFIKNRAE